MINHKNFASHLCIPEVDTIINIKEKHFPFFLAPIINYQVSLNLNTFKLNKSLYQKMHCDFAWMLGFNIVHLIDDSAAFPKRTKIIVNFGVLLSISIFVIN